MRLLDITLCDGADICLPPTAIEWTSGGDLNQGFTKSDISSAESIPTNYQVYGSGDYNGDGLTDFYLQLSASDGRAAQSTASNPPLIWLSKDDRTFNQLTLPVTDGIPSLYRVYGSGDFNGDGLTDLFLNDSRADGRTNKPAQSKPAEVWLSIGDGTFNRIVLPLADSMPDLYRVYGSGDFNGDGLTDLFLNFSRNDGRAVQAVAGSEVYSMPQIWLSNGDGTFNRSELPASDSMPDFYQIYGSGDFNGDGLTDLYLQLSASDGRAAQSTASNPPLVWLSIGDGTFNRLTRPIADGIPNLNRVFGSGDFNGDGLSDLYLQNSRKEGRAADGGSEIWLSQGDGTFDRIAVPDSENMPEFYQTFASGDFNGDGLTDLYIQGARSDGRAFVGEVEGPTPGQIWLSNGDGTFDRLIKTADESIENDHTVFGLGDFDGDGLTDLYIQKAAADGRASTAGQAQLWASPGPVPDILSTVTNGIGAETSITYRPMTDSSVYTKDTGAEAASHPIVDIISPMQITSRVERSDGVGGLRVSTYRYKGAKMDLTGRGFLGFREMTERDEQTGIEQTSVYEQYYPKTLMMKSQTRSLNSVVLGNTVNSYDTEDLGGTRKRVFLTQSVASGADLNGSPLPSSTTTYHYDTFSNATEIVVTASDGFSKTTTNTYLNDTANWLLGRLLTADVTSTAPAVAAQTPVEDATPDAFDFTDVPNGSPGTVYEDSAAMTGFNRSVTATVSGADAEIRKNGTGNWGTSVSISPGETLNLRMTSNAAHGAAVTTTVTVGGVSADWIVSNSRAVIISSNTNAFNLRAAHDALYPAPTGSENPPINVVAIVEPGVIIGSTSTAVPAFTIGDWPAGIPITVEVKGRIQGKGGDGGNAGINSHRAGFPGENGGTAFYTRYPIKLVLTDGTPEIFGGGGGGAGGTIKDSGKQAGSGGGGAGQLPGQPGAEGNGNSPVHIGQPGTTETGGAGGQKTTGEAQSGGVGGGIAEAGQHTGTRSFGSLIPGGEPGAAIDGSEFITKTGTGDIRGAEISNGPS